MIHWNEANSREGSKRFVVLGAAEVRILVDWFGQRHLDLSTIQD